MRSKRLTLPPHPPDGTIFDNAGKPVSIDKVQQTHAYLIDCVKHLTFRQLDSGKDYDLADRRKRRRR